MNPHFYFNTLNAINSFILQSDIRSANKFLTTFSKLMRDTLENSQKEFVTIGEEKEVLAKYLSLQQLRFPGLFEFVIEASDDVLNKKIPPMFLQPFVENSVEYAFRDMLEKGELKITFIKDNNQISCSVCDNGVGIKKSKQIIANKKRKSTAINNIYNRISLLNKIYNVSIKLEISQLSPENKKFPGTLTKLSIPDFDLIIPDFKH
jgi:LytS/YehU family sensor histidine kinase